jgi:hypothetical protein
LHIGFARDADRLADEPRGFRADGDFGRIDRCRGRDGANEEDFALVGVDLDVAGLDEAFGEGPNDGARGESFGELRVEGGGKSGIAGVLPLGMPPGCHAKQQADAEGLPGDDGCGVGNQFGLNEFLSVVNLRICRPGQCQNSEYKTNCFHRLRRFAKTQ